MEIKFSPCCTASDARCFPEGKTPFSITSRGENGIAASDIRLKQPEGCQSGPSYTHVSKYKQSPRQTLIKPNRVGRRKIQATPPGKVGVLRGEAKTFPNGQAGRSKKGAVAADVVNPPHCRPELELARPWRPRRMTIIASQKRLAPRVSCSRSARPSSFRKCPASQTVISLRRVSEAAQACCDGCGTIRWPTVNTIFKQADEIYRLRVLRARQSSAVERMWEGPRLFEMACVFTRAGAAQQAEPDGAEAEFQRRMAIAKILDAQPIR